jgi:hypothetical protein
MNVRSAHIVTAYAKTLCPQTLLTLRDDPHSNVSVALSIYLIEIIMEFTVLPSTTEVNYSYIAEVVRDSKMYSDIKDSLNMLERGRFKTLVGELDKEIKRNVNSLNKTLANITKVMEKDPVCEAIFFEMHADTQDAHNLDVSVMLLRNIVFSYDRATDDKQERIMNQMFDSTDGPWTQFESWVNVDVSHLINSIYMEYKS